MIRWRRRRRSEVEEEEDRIGWRAAGRHPLELRGGLELANDEAGEKDPGGSFNAKCLSSL